MRCSVASEWRVLVLVRPTLFGKRVERGGKGRSYIGFPPPRGELRFDARVVNKPDRPHEHTRGSDVGDDAASIHGARQGVAEVESGWNRLQPATFPSSFPFLPAKLLSVTRATLVV